MDIEYLLALQQLRSQLGSIPETIMVGVSYIGDGPALVAIALIVYWCINKRVGLAAIVSMGLGNFVSQLIKNIACVYRPWIRDTRIIPAEAAIEGAAGYSFPSGHTCGTTTTFGSMAWNIRRNHKFIGFLLVVFIILVAFSRNYLGVHTPQDVLVGFLIALITIAIVQAFLGWMDRCDAMLPGHKKDIVVTVVVLILCAASIAVVLLKPYPLDYVNGQLLVDPEAMQKGSFEGAGLFGGLAVGWLLERRFVAFSTGAEVGKGERVVRGVVGVIIVGAVYVGGDIVFKAVLPYLWAKLCAYFCLVVVAIWLVPLVFKLIQKRFRPEPKRRGAHAS